MIDRYRALRARWSRGVNAVMVDCPVKPDGDILRGALLDKRLRIDDAMPSGHSWGPSLAKELEARGYDLTTLKFSIQKKAS